jgi:hypothetical protein
MFSSKTPQLFKKFLKFISTSTLKVGSLPCLEVGSDKRFSLLQFRIINYICKCLIVVGPAYSVLILKFISISTLKVGSFPCLQVGSDKRSSLLQFRIINYSCKKFSSGELWREKRLPQPWCPDNKSLLYFQWGHSRLSLRTNSIKLFSYFNTF